MCIVFYTLSQPGYKFILASNRDEYLDRPTLPAGWHTFAPLRGDHPAASGSACSSKIPPAKEGDAPWVLSGRDAGAPAGGTWLGITRDLRIAVLTNIRIPSVPVPPHAPSRGLLLKDFLAPRPTEDRVSVHEYLTAHHAQVDQYEGFNLLLFQFHPKPPGQTSSTLHPNDRGSKDKITWGKPEWGYLSNRPAPTVVDIHSPSRYPSPLPDENGLASPRREAECFGLSNTPLSQPWPKVVKGEENMRQTLQEWTENKEGEDELIERLMTMLQQTRPLDSIKDLSRCTCLHPVPLGKNPDQPIQEGETPRWYGTRVTTVILVREDGQVSFVERDIFVLDQHGKAVKGSDERRLTFQAEIVDKNAS